MNSSVSPFRRYLPWLLVLLGVEAIIFARMDHPQLRTQGSSLPFTPVNPSILRRASYDSALDPLIGTQGPRVALKDLAGRTITLGKSGSHPIVVVFVSDCSSCVGGATLLQSDALQQGHPWVRVFVASQERAAEIRAAMVGHDYKLTVLLDEGGRCARSYNALWYPRAYVLDEQGRVLFVQSDSQQETEAIREVSRLLEARVPVRRHQAAGREGSTGDALEPVR